MGKIKLILGASILLLAVTPVNAETIGHVFSGVITEVDFNTSDPFAGTVVVGTAFSGFYEFDSNQFPFFGDACQLIGSQLRHLTVLPLQEPTRLIRLVVKVQAARRLMLRPAIAQVL